MKKVKYCSFYVSDIHLITMLLPYINEKTKEGIQFVTKFEVDISKSAKMVIESLSLNKKKKLKLLNINWRESKRLEESLENKYVLVMGSNEYIKRINSELDLRNEDFIIINCFEVSQAEHIMEDIIEHHSKVLNTKGENDINEIFTECTKNSNKKITIIK